MLDNIWKAHDLSPWQNNFMIQVHGKTILSMEFKSIIKAYGLNPWQFYQWNSNPIRKAHDSTSWQIICQNAQFSLAIFKVQFSLATSKAQFSLATLKAQFSLAIFETQFSLAIFKTQFSLAISNAQFTLVPLKAQTNYLTLFYQKPKVINTWQNTILQAHEIYGNYLFSKPMAIIL